VSKFLKSLKKFKIGTNYIFNSIKLNQSKLIKFNWEKNVFYPCFDLAKHSKYNNYVETIVYLIWFDLFPT